MDLLYDVIIIGGGIVGCAAARVLSRYSLKILLLEKEDDISCGASKANSGILHAGYDCEPGTLKAELNIQGIHLYRDWVKTLDIPCRNTGSLVIGGEEDRTKLRELYERGLKNSVPGMSLLTGEEARKLEPNLRPDVKGALLAETACVFSPYEAAIAFAENAAVNGVDFLLNTEAASIRQEKNYFIITANKGEFHSKIIVNAAGVESAVVHNYISNKKEKIEPQRGQYYLLDNTQRDLVKRIIFQLPTHLGKGVLVVPTVDYNMLIGPTAEEIEDGHDSNTTREGLQEALDKAGLSISFVPIRDRISAFAGVRAKHRSRDFIIEEFFPGFIGAIGIDSPGLSAAPAIALRISGFIENRLQPKEKVNYIKERMGIKKFRSLSFNEQKVLVNENPAYGRIICRCETVSEAEIMEAIRRPVGAKNLDALKRRTRAQMGRCQGGFCTIRLMEILSKELGVPETEVTKCGNGSNIVESTL